ncbi:MAG: serine/threonine-protein kinase, partial [Kofleriaceae bacterium]
MPDVVGFIAVVMSLGMAPAIIKIRSDAKLKQRKLELEAGEGGGKQGQKLLEENKLLRERIENLESIVSSVDYELNQKMIKLLDERRSLVLPPGAPAAPATAGAPVAPPTTPAGLDATMTAAPTKDGGKIVGTALESGQMLAGRYRVQRLLGKGGMGAVYLADDEVLHELVALKVISSAYAADESAMIARFRREASAARKVSSPQVIRIHDLGEARPGLLYLSMEYFSGRTLAEVIAQRGMVPMKDVADILQQIGTGLEAAHAAGVIHRDLKPSNVL